MKYIMFLLTLASAVHAERWLVLPPRTELQNEKLNTADLARLVALFLKVSRVSEIVSVTEGEACLKTANASIETRISAETLSQVAKNCMAERLLVFRIRKKSDEYELTSKVFFRESGGLTDTLTNSGENLLEVFGRNLRERFGSSPQAPKENAADLIVAGDTYGGSYFEWAALKPYLLSTDSIKTSYCLTGADGKLASFMPNDDRVKQKDFLDRIKVQGSGLWAEASAVLGCTETAINLSRREGRHAILLMMVSDAPREHAVKINLRAQLRKLAAKSRIIFAASSTATEETRKFWATLSRELGENSQYLPIAQHAKVGLASGDEWHIFRQGGRIYESRKQSIKNLESGVKIPEKYALETSPQDLVRLYEKLSGNKVISEAKVTIDSTAVTDRLRHFFKTSDGKNAPHWRVQLRQNDQNYYISLNATQAQKLKAGEYARVFIELLKPSETEVIRTRPSPAIVISEAHDSPKSYEVDLTQFIKKPSHYLSRSIATRSFYVVTGTVISIIPPEPDAIENGF